MMEREIHLEPHQLLQFLQFKEGDFGQIAIVSGQLQRAQRCLQYLENPIKNFTFLGYTFWTGIYKGKRVTVGNGGFFAPDTAFVSELLCAGGIKTLIRIGSCGALKKEIQIGDFVIVDKVIRGDGASGYYVQDDFEPAVDKELTLRLEEIFKKIGNIHRGGVWTTDALFRETKDIVNSYIKKGAISVDMVSSPFVTIANLYQVRVAAVLAVSDNLITGELGFSDFRFFAAEEKMTEAVFTTLD